MERLVKDQLIKDVAVDRGYSEDVVDKVISFQGEDMLRAFREHSQVDISGFGTIFVSPGKLERRIKRYENYIDNPKYAAIQGNVENVLKILKSKTCLKRKNCLKPSPKD